MPAEPLILKTKEYQLQAREAHNKMDVGTPPKPLFFFYYVKLSTWRNHFSLFYFKHILNLFTFQQLNAHLNKVQIAQVGKRTKNSVCSSLLAINSCGCLHARTGKKQNLCYDLKAQINSQYQDKRQSFFPLSPEVNRVTHPQPPILDPNTTYA